MFWLATWACAPVPSDPVHAEVSGCAGFGRAGQCLLPPGGAVTVWVAGDTPPGGAAWIPAPGGFRATFEAPGAQIAAGAWTLAVEPWPPRPAIEEARALLGRGEREAAVALLRAEPDAGPERRAERLVVLEIVEDGAPDPAVAEGLAAEGLRWHAARLALVYAHRTIDSGDALGWVARAREWLGPEPVDASLAGDADYVEGVFHQRRADHRRALAALERAAARAQRVGATAASAEAERLRAGSLVRSGDSAAVALLGARMEAGLADLDPCGRAPVLNSYAWAVLQLADAGVPGATGDPVPPLERALALLDGAACSQEHDRAEYTAQVRLNLALAALLRGDPADAQGHLDAARRADPELWEPWSLEIEARIAAAQGDHLRAIAVWQRAQADAGDRLELAWMARRGQGLSLEALGRRAEAIAALADAQALFFRQSLLVPVHLGRAAYLEQRDGATAHLAELLIADGRPRDAFDALRSQRAQYLAGLHQTTRLAGTVPPGFREALDGFRAERRALDALPAEWSVPIDERPALAAERARREAEALRWFDEGTAQLGVRVDLTRRRAGPGEVLVGWYPLERGWIGFAERDGRVVVHRWADLPGDDALLAPFADLVRGAERVTLLPHARLADRDLHAAVVDGRPLATWMFVRYGLDLVAAEPLAPEVGRAVLVTDPRRDLASASAEADVVRGGLPGVQAIAGDAATAASVGEALGRADWLHFSGHAAARDGWSSYLALAGEDELDVAAVLALGRAPRRVVLNACETGQERAGSLGVAQAFVVAGAETVVATARPVEDTLALAFADALYAAPPGDLGPAYVRALDRLARERPDADWASYRLVVQ